MSFLYDLYKCQSLKRLHVMSVYFMTTELSKAGMCLENITTNYKIFSVIH